VATIKTQNRSGLSAVAFVTYMIMSGFLTQTGIIIGPLSATQMKNIGVFGRICLTQ
jgi:hypothetical protein